MSPQRWRLRLVHEGEDGLVLNHPGGEVRIDGRRPGDGALPIRTGLTGAVQLPAGIDTMAYTLPSGRLRQGSEAFALSMEISGGRLVYLGHALHAETSRDWLQQAVEQFAGADWLLVGVPEGGGPSVVEHLPAFCAAQVVILDMRPPQRTNKITTHIALWVDQLKTAGLPVMGVAPQVSIRFE